MFLGEIQFQCEIIIGSYNDLIQLLQNHPREVNNFKFRVWALVQSILTSTANISKIFNPQNHSDKLLEQEMKERGEELKKMLFISDESPLLSRDVRNHFEHFDERLHVCAKESRIFNHRNIGPTGSIRISSDTKISPKSYMANFDPHELVITFWEQKLRIQDIISEAQTLLKNTQTELSKLYGFGFW